MNNILNFYWRFFGQGFFSIQPSERSISYFNSQISKPKRSLSCGPEHISIIWYVSHPGWDTRDLHSSETNKRVQIEPGSTEQEKWTKSNMTICSLIAACTAKWVWKQEFWAWIWLNPLTERDCLFCRTFVKLCVAETEWSTIEAVWP